MVISFIQALSYVSLGLTFSLITLKLIISYIFMKHYLKNRENQLILGASLYFLCIFISRIFMMYFDYFLTEFNPNSYQMYIIQWKVGNAFTFLGYFWLIFMSERAIFQLKTKYIISIVYVIFIVISLTFTDYLATQLMASIPTGVAIVIVPLSYLYLAKHQEIRKYALSIFFGYILFIIGFLILAESLVAALVSISSNDPIVVRLSLHIASVFIKISSLPFFLYGYRINIEIK